MRSSTETDIHAQHESGLNVFMFCGIVCLWDDPSVSNIVETDALSNTVQNAQLAGTLPGFGSQRKSFLSYSLWPLSLFLTLFSDLPVELDWTFLLS